MGIPLQSRNPGAQLTIVQVPFTHAEIPFAVIHTWPQAPQLFTSLLRLVSHPSAGFELQLAKPGLQLATMHCPFTHAGVLFTPAHT
jgi:hypothetical protein